METVSITTAVKSEQIITVNFPKYFKHLQTYHMVLNDKMILSISDFGLDHFKSAGLFSSMRYEKINGYYIDRISEFEPITEDQFKEIFTKVYVELEALMN